jgi:hypothetical protein
MTVQMPIDAGSKPGFCRICGLPTSSGVGICTRDGRCKPAYERERIWRDSAQWAEALRRWASRIRVPTFREALACYASADASPCRRGAAAFRLVAVLASERFLRSGRAAGAEWRLAHSVLDGQRPPAGPTLRRFAGQFRGRAARLGRAASLHALREWRRKYREGGVDGLLDHRGRKRGLGWADLTPELRGGLLRELARGRSTRKTLQYLRREFEARGIHPSVRRLQEILRPFRALRLVGGLGEKWT